MKRFEHRPLLAGRALLITLLRESVGDTVAAEAIDRAAAELALNGTTLSRAQALKLLERVAENEGLVGIAARFAKSKIHLGWG